MMISGHSRSAMDRGRCLTGADALAWRAGWMMPSLPSWGCGRRPARCANGSASETGRNRGRPDTTLNTATNHVHWPARHGRPAGHQSGAPLQSSSSATAARATFAARFAHAILICDNFLYGLKGARSALGLGRQIGSDRHRAPQALAQARRSSRPAGGRRHPGEPSHAGRRPPP
jgi:hypothetical protein